MKKLNEDIKHDLERWDKIGFIVLSASISDKGVYLPDDPNANDSGIVEQSDNGYPYLSDQYLKAHDMDFSEKGFSNEERTNNLKKELRVSGYSFKPAWGVYDGGQESSFMVFPMKVVKGEIEEVPFEELYNFGKSLVKDYSQWSFHVHKPGAGIGKVTNDNGYGEEDDVFEKTVGESNDNYETRTVNPKKPSSRNHAFSDDFVDGGLNHKLTDRDFEDIFSSAK